MEIACIKNVVVKYAFPLCCWFFSFDWRKKGKKSFLLFFHLHVVSHFIFGPDAQVFADLRTAIDNLAGNVYLCGNSLGGF